jgi:hypothetical protein
MWGFQQNMESMERYDMESYKQNSLLLQDNRSGTKKNPTVRIYEAYLLIISSASERDCLDALSLSFRSFMEFCNSVFDVLKESSCFCFSSSANWRDLVWSR